MTIRVLVVGYRRGLGAALRRRGVRFAIWHDRALTVTHDAGFVHVGPFANGAGEVLEELRKVLEYGPFTHVVAGVERAVVTASLARRVCGARLFVHTVASRCHDKVFMKERLRARGIAVTDFVDGNRTDGRAAFEQLGSPMVVKSRVGSGSRGILFVRAADEASRLDLRGKIAERFVDGAEVSVESWVAGGTVRYSNITDYLVRGRSNLVPADLPAEQTAEILDLNRRTVEALRISWGMTHCEIYRTEAGLLVGEIALRAPGGYIMDLIGIAHGFDPWDALLAMELDLPFDFPEAPGRFAGALMFHPGPGIVRVIEGVEELRSRPEVRKLRVKVKVGDVVGHRVGVGVDVGHLLVSASSAAEVRASLERAGQTVRMEVDAPGGGAV